MWKDPKHTFSPSSRSVSIICSSDAVPCLITAGFRKPSKLNCNNLFYLGLPRSPKQGQGPELVT
jgi:hypothetical protein